MKIISRSAWGARKPKRTPYRVDPSRRRLFVVHWSGAAATQTVRAIQDWCMDGRDFADIDYNLLVRGTTGEVYEGRGWDVVGSHAEGHNTEGIGVCVIGRGEFTPAAQASLRALYAEACRRTGRKLDIKVHRELDATACPGDAIAKWVRAGGLVDEPASKPPRLLKLAHPYLRGDDVKAVQRKVRAAADGIYGPDTEARVRKWQRDHGLVADGIVGPATRRAMGLDR